VKIVSTPCPYCKYIIDDIPPMDNKPSKPGDITICFDCGEILILGPYLTPLKCNLTPDQLADKLGLVMYGSLLIIQKHILEMKKQFE